MTLHYMTRVLVSLAGVAGIGAGALYATRYVDYVYVGLRTYLDVYKLVQTFVGQHYM